MECLRCGRSTDYDRVAVSRSSGTVEGSLCVDCEATWMNGHAESTNVGLVACLDCGDESELFFPRWDSIVESEDEGSVETEYRIRLTTPSGCRECTDR
ncbi:hypothetical protein [Halobacterium yunchengense]|uniref:hypothetical protein n=1 Tax=Halobacterium yunchengense TaxID=3108497 RepID=UPI003008D320